MPFRTYYDVLEVPRTATVSEIKIAYRRQAMHWHPDRNSRNDAAARFRDINEAYQCLADPRSRRDYDVALRDAEARGYGYRDRRSTECHEYPECVPCAFNRLWVEFQEEFTIRPENVVALFAAIERWVRRIAVA